MKDPMIDIFAPHEAFYLTSLVFCTESALTSTSYVAEILSENEDGKFDLPPQPLLNELQNIANQAAAISRFFWPVGKKYKRRGERLREVFGVTEERL
jgi:hypothetical protein